jgi:VanZ family protein
MPKVGGLSNLMWLGIDKWTHFVMYFILCFAWSKETLRVNHSIMLFLIATVIMGAGIELLQLYTTKNRSGEWGDFFADLAGLFVANFFVVNFGKKGEN